MDMDMEYRIIRSNRKSLAIELTRDCEVLVRAPRRVTKAEIERFVEKHEKWIDENLERLRKRRQAYPEPDEAQRLELIEKARALLPGRVSYFAGMMGLCPTGIRVTGARSRFGSCSAKNSLCFSWRLMQYPAEAIDYVVVHELAHIVHKNHGKDFYALVASVLPDYKQRQKLLRP